MFSSPRAISYTCTVPLPLGVLPRHTIRAEHGTHLVSYGVNASDLCMCSMICGASVVSMVAMVRRVVW